MLVTLVQDIGNLLKMLVTCEVFKILKVLGFLCKFMLGNKWIDLLGIINWWSRPQYNMEIMLQD